eukprot:4802807-Amphidinium_carterae.1
MPAALTFNLVTSVPVFIALAIGVVLPCSCEATSKYNWDFRTVPQRHLDGRRLHAPRGKVLGGSSSLNAMAYVLLLRGHFMTSVTHVAGRVLC